MKFARFRIKKNKMLYVGYPVYFETALKLIPPSPGTNLNDQLATQGLTLYEIDKGVCILGLEVPEIHISDRAYQSVDDGLRHILDAKKKVVAGLKALNANLSRFEIAPMEEETIWVENPEPYLITTGF